MPVTRRGLLNGLARLGGAGAVYEALALWDFLKPPPASAASLASAQFRQRQERRDPRGGRRRALRGL